MINIVELFGDASVVVTCGAEGANVHVSREAKQGVEVEPSITIKADLDTMKRLRRSIDVAVAYMTHMGGECQ